MNKSYIIAEIGNTHEGSLGFAKQFIKAAAECGVDAVKIQTHIFDTESLPSAPNPPYFKEETSKEYFDRTAFTIGQWECMDHERDVQNLNQLCNDGLDILLGKHEYFVHSKYNII